MTPEQFKYHLSSLPADTPITAEHIITILSSLGNTPKIDENYSQWDKDKLINQKVLADWLGESESTIEKWRRKKGDGPDPIFKKGKVSYRVGAVREWLDKKTHGSIGEYQESLRKEKMTKLGLKAFSSTVYGSVFPTIYSNDIAYPFFESFNEELDITGYQTIHAEQDSLAEWLLSVNDLNIDPHSIISELHNRVEEGEDINALQNLMINGVEVQYSLSHLIAGFNVSNFEHYSYLVQGFLDVDLNFRQKNSNNETALDFADNHGNNALIKMINSYELYIKLNNELPNK